MNTLTKVAAIVLVLLALMLGLLAYRMAKAPPPAPAPVAVLPAESGPPVATASQPVLVAAAALQAGRPIAAEALKVVNWPVAPAQGYTSVEDVAGKTLKMDVAPGEPILRSQLAQGLASYLKPDERAVSIGVDELVGVSNTVAPGDLVDIFISLDKNQEVDGSQTRLMLSRVRVLAYGNKTIDGPAVAPETGGRGGQPAAPRTAVLALPLDKVNELLLASKAGRLHFALRSPQDESLPDAALFVARQPALAARADLSAAQRAMLERPENAAFAGESLVEFSGPKPPAPAPVAAHRPRASGGGRTIEIIRGGQSETVRY